MGKEEAEEPLAKIEYTKIKRKKNLAKYFKPPPKDNITSKIKNLCVNAADMKLMPSKKPAKKTSSKASKKFFGEDAGQIQRKPGQKYPEPSLDDPARAFYESLYQENPMSPMAQKYCLEYGLLPERKAAKLLNKK